MAGAGAGAKTGIGAGAAVEFATTPRFGFAALAALASAAWAVACDNGCSSWAGGAVVPEIVKYSSGGSGTVRIVLYTKGCGEQSTRSWKAGEKIQEKPQGQHQLRWEAVAAPYGSAGQFVNIKARMIMVMSAFCSSTHFKRHPWLGAL